MIKYTYNNLGWLIEEDNAITYKIYTYVYDSAGNIIRVTETDKTPNDGFIQMGVVGDGTASTFALLPPSLAVTTYNYSYTDSEWGDLLTKYNGVDITYDEIGNPLSYYNGSSYTFTWDGRRLVTAVKGTDTMSFAYDFDGLRISKTVNGTTTHYVYDGELLVAEYTDEIAIVYIYDANDSPIGFKCRESTYAEDIWDVYWYGKNLQGDIAIIYNSAGTKLVSYTYTAWGNTTKTYHNGGASTTAAYNNLTYRGYYYDTDLGMYYLQTRYYDPTVCRFINADDIGYLGANNDITGYNLYSYCSNNPVMYMDYSGEARMPFEDLAWPGQIHREVQLYLASKGYTIEYTITGVGRIDIVNGNSKEAYEIKPFTYNSKLGRELAINQLLQYTNNSTFTVGTDKPELHDSFVSSDGEYYITFHYVGDGLIFYTFRENGVSSKSHSFSAVPSKNKNNQKSVKVATVAFAACVCIAFSGSPGNLLLKTNLI